MEFPFGHGHSSHSHTHHHHQHRRDEEETGDYPPPPPPPGNTFSSYGSPPPPQPPSFYGVPTPPPPSAPGVPTQVFHTSHVTPPGSGYVSHDLNPPPPPRPHHQADSFNYGYPSDAPYPPSAPAAPASVHHVSHEVRVGQLETRHGHHHPNLPASVHHVSHEGGSGSALNLSNKRTVRVITKAAPDYSLTIRYGKVVLAPSDPGDQYQHWYKDEKYSTKVKDKEGCPGFSLVNKVTGEAIKHSIGATHAVRLIPYNPDYLDESILWTESKDLGDGHRAIRMVNNIHLNVDAYHGDKKSGGVHDGTTIVLWDWNKGDNQRWKITQY